MPAISPARSRIQRAGSRRARDLRHRIAADIRQAREDAGLSQRALARGAGIGSATLHALERGVHDPSTEVLARVAAALGMDLGIRLYPGTGPALRDHLQAPMIESLIRDLHARWRSIPEVTLRGSVRGAIDLVLDAGPTPGSGLTPTTGPRLDGGLVLPTGPTPGSGLTLATGPTPGSGLVLPTGPRLDGGLNQAGGAGPDSGVDQPAEPLVACEAHSDLRRLEQQLRWSRTKAGALAEARGRPVSCLLLLRSTRRTRAIAREFAVTLARAFPAAAVDAYAALTGERPWPGDALLWCDMSHGRARLLPQPPRGVAVGR